MKATASADNSQLYFTPPELLMDVPFNMGCYEMASDNSFTAEAEMLNPSPANCIVMCAALGSEYRHAGIKSFHYNYHKII